MSSHEDEHLLSRRAALKAIAAVSVCPLMISCEFVDIHDEGENEDPGGNQSQPNNGSSTDPENNSEAPDGTQFSLDDPELEALGSVGGTACFAHGSQDLVLVRASDDDIIAFDRTCPHQGFDLRSCSSEMMAAEWDEEEGTITCPWHDSAFDRDGTLVKAPTSDPDFNESIRVYPVDFDAETGEGVVLNQ